jgi:phosphoglycolate phosphatase
MPGFEFPSSQEGEVLVNPRIAALERAGHYRAPLPVVELPRDHEKPDPRGLLRICEDHGVSPEQVLVIGDSVRKDVGVARQVGARALWAEYGTYVSIEYRERLDVISAPAITRRHAASLIEGDEGSGPPVEAISNFSGVLRHLGRG